MAGEAREMRRVRSSLQSPFDDWVLPRYICGMNSKFPWNSFIRLRGLYLLRSTAITDYSFLLTVFIDRRHCVCACVC